jgi:tellurite methyltransferase
MPDRGSWTERWANALGEEAARGGGPGRAPSSWVIERCLALPPDAVIVDVAAGVGRHAVALAQGGRRVIALDYVEEAVQVAVRAHPRVQGVVADAGALPFAPGSLDALLTVNFLDRELFPVFAGLLKPGGSLIVETYTLEQRALVERGQARAPRAPAYMLGPGELAVLVAPLEVMDLREGLVDDGAGARHVASIVAVRRT